MTSTTLMTFLLRTPPSVRSVQLLGSWDNFARPYAMEQDKRIGAGHWRGCHTFTDIICDGSTNDLSPGRSGGLKMGGTYWYYYLLDNDVEYYNEAEPVTTLCPLLPGQPVNVLCVPVILPDTKRSHRRDSSVSSQRSGYRTMNPEDKYMNPRTPPKPKLARLKTSPPLYQQANASWSSLVASPLNAVGYGSASQPTSAMSTPGYCTARKESISKVARSASPPRSRGFRAAFLHLTAPHSVDTDAEDCRGRSAARQEDRSDCDVQPGTKCADEHWLFVPDAGYSSSNYSSRQVSQASSAGHDSTGKFPFRRPALDRKESHPPLSIQNRRASKSTSREPSPVSNYLKVHTLSEDNRFGDGLNPATTRRLETLKEASSQQSSPFLSAHDKTPLATGDPTTPRPFNPMEKRLPTLPNTPSSVMDEALRAIDAQNAVLDMEILCSHFSDCTSTDESCANSFHENSRFSEWSTDSDTEMVSPASMTSASTFNNEKQNSSAFDGALPELSLEKLPCKASSIGPATPTLNTIPESFSPTTVADRVSSPHLRPSSGLSSIALSPDDLNISGLCIGNVKDGDSNPKRHAAMFDRLKSIESIPQPPVSASPARTAFSDQNDRVPDAAPSVGSKVSELGRFSDEALSHSSTMQELMDELSYLGDIIQADVRDIC